MNAAPMPVTEMCRRVMVHEEKLKEAHMLIPAAFNPASSSSSPPPYFDAAPPPPTAFPAAVAGPGLPQVYAPPHAGWLQQLADRARAEGLIEGRDPRQPGLPPVPNNWWCEACERDVDLGQLEAHVTSKRHVNADARRRYERDLQARQAQGVLPWFLEVRDGQEYCTLCFQFATEEHLRSSRHQSRLAWQTPSAPPPAVMNGVEGAHMPVAQPPPGPYYCMPAALPPPAPSAVPRPPDNWGNPNFFEWRPQNSAFWCRLCWKYADDNHVTSQKHVGRTVYPDSYLGCDPIGGEGGQAPPPPPPQSYSRTPISSGPPPPPSQGFAPSPPPAAGPPGHSSGQFAGMPGQLALANAPHHLEGLDPGLGGNTAAPAQPSSLGFSTPMSGSTPSTCMEGPSIQRPDDWNSTAPPGWRRVMHPDWKRFYYYREGDASSVTWADPRESAQAGAAHLNGYTSPGMASATFAASTSPAAPAPPPTTAPAAPAAAPAGAAWGMGAAGVEQQSRLPKRGPASTAMAPAAPASVAPTAAPAAAATAAARDMPTIRWVLMPNNQKGCNDNCPDHYYFNKVTRESVWELPEGAVFEEDF
eukprot:gnl/TRDRNA2_/TRDRNA2_41418_c0_seq1.p1 gnl/TRDRNA2_/TRDRNA2_41418_c0~~gnl/TRDRNA2_/TRDRNA2_41418_c0_seq1.p1  ORF type:complete len:634 (+),score=94.03 gnl/TRDRNA2_/TRDRNA2_41418_c0_seq1:149-1903(+)